MLSTTMCSDPVVVTGNATARFGLRLHSEASHRLGLAWKGEPMPVRHTPLWLMRLLGALAARRDGGFLRDVTAMYALYGSLSETLGDPEPARRMLGFELLSVEAVGRRLRDGSLGPAAFPP